MSDVRPFRALRYDPACVDLGRVLVPPYDVIAAADRARFYERDPHSAIRLELTRDVAEEETTDYSEIRRTLAAWRESKVLVRDAQPAFYGLRQRYTALDGRSGEREGFFGLLRLEDYERGIVRPHEQTLAAPKADRLKVLRATRANLSSVFLLYEDHEDVLPPLLASDFEHGGVVEAPDDAGATQRLMRLQDPERVEALVRFMAKRPLVIADGHHRYETALSYRDEQRARHPDAGPDAPFEFLLAYFANAFAPGSLLLPIHRLILRGSAPSEATWSERLPGWTRSSVAAASADAIPGLLAEHLEPLRGRYAFAADDASGTLHVFSKPIARDGELSVRLIHREVIAGVFGLDDEAVRGGAVAYPKGALQTAHDLRAGRGCVALYLKALAPDDVFRVTEAGELMPQKSTFFFPKLPTGLVFRLFDEAGA
jgi:uncharacterized protein (DUF1015 family)